MQVDDEHPAGHALLCVLSVREVADLGSGDPARVTEMEVAQEDTGVIGAEEQALASADGHGSRGVVYGHGRLSTPANDHRNSTRLRTRITLGSTSKCSN